MKTRRGHALLELLTAATLLGMVGTAAAALLQAQSRLARTMADRAAANESIRTARDILTAELRELTPSDVRAVARDSLALRLFRGWAIVCDVRDSTATLRLRGARDPEPNKDSLLIVGEETTRSFRRSARVAACDHVSGERLLAVVTEPPLSPGRVLAVFESGVYHWHAHALRYRRAAEGRQPLTDELIDHRRSEFAAVPGGVSFQIVPRTNNARPFTRVVPLQ